MKKIVFMLVAFGFCFNAIGQTKSTKKSTPKQAEATPNVGKPVPTKNNELKPAEGQVEVSPEDADIATAKMIEYMTPSEQHAMLANYAGEWMAEISTWTSEKLEPVVSSGKCTMEMIMGGRYLQSMYSGEFTGMPFEGKGTVGYNNSAKKFYSTWIDNMGTGIMFSSGVIDPKTKNLVFNSEQLDPITSKMIKVREVYSVATDMGWSLEMYTTPLNGKEFKSMMIKFSK